MKYDAYKAKLESGDEPNLEEESKEQQYEDYNPPQIEMKEEYNPPSLDQPSEEQTQVEEPA